ncbi:hypothetical protein BO71DRAFT_393611, partial [Aspergillus ellipticus CBS 707.79]
MALASASGDQPTTALFRLFHAVTPHFASIASQRASDHRDHGERRIPYVLFEADLILLGLRQAAIAGLVGPDSMAPTRDACMERITQMLGILESILPQERIPTEDTLGYPLLEGLRAGTVSCSTFDLALADGDQYGTVSRFSQCARDLDRLCIDDTHLIPPKRHKRQPSFETTRALARLLYECVADHWQCECNSCHGSMLYLQTHCRQEPSRAHLDFNMLFTRSSATSYKWYDGVVNVTLPDPSSSSVLPPSQGGLGADSSPKVTIRYSLTAEPSPPRQRGVVVGSICLALPASNLSILNLGIQGGQISKRQPPRERAAAPTYNQAVSLGEILQMTPPLPLKLRRILAVVIAHSALQLFDTRWLPSTLTSTRVIFMQTDRGQVVPRPLLAARLSEPTSREVDEADLQDLAHSSPFVLSLGIILLELWFGKHISELRDATDMAPDGVEDPNTDLFTAQRLWEQSEWDMHTQYRNAVGACLNEDDSVPENPSAASLCRWLYEKVVSPIENQLADEFNTNIEDVDNLLFSMGKTKDRRAIGLAQQKHLLNRSKRPHPDVLVHTSPVKRRQMANQYRPGRRWSPCSDPEDE